MHNNLSIVKELASIDQEYYNGSVEIIAGLPYRQHQLIRMIEYYSNSRYLESQLDAQGKEKPFYNIINGMIIVENAAKDIDTKDIQATSDNGQYDRSFVLSKDIYEWMKTTGFGQVINEMKEAHSRYGGVLVKKCIEEDEDGEQQLYIKVETWKNLVTDQIDIMGGVKIVKHYMLPSEIMAKKDVWHNCEDAIKLAHKGQYENDYGSTTTKRVVVYEITGQFPRAYYKQALNDETVIKSENDETDYSNQLYYIAGKIGQDQVILYEEDYVEDMHKYLARKKKAGRGLGIGVPEEGEQAQIWTNDAVQKQVRAFDLSSRVVGQSASKKLKGRNMLSEVDNGVILEHEPNNPITTVPLVPSGGLAQFENLISQWYNQYEKVTNQYDAQRGEAPPSGTAFRLQAQVLQQSSSVFNDLKEEMELFIVEIFEDWIMPFLAKKINKAHLLSHEFTTEELKEIDRNFSTNRANTAAKKAILSGQVVTQEDYDTFLKDNVELIKQTKSQRFLDIPKDYYKDLDSKITITAGSESRNKAAILESLNNIMMLYAKNPQIAQDPVMSQLFMKALELSGAGISPISIMGAVAESAKMQQEAAAQAQPQPGQPAQSGQPTAQPLSLTANPNGQ